MVSAERRTASSTGSSSTPRRRTSTWANSRSGSRAPTRSNESRAMEKVLSVFANIASGDPRERLRALGFAVGVPLAAIAAFLWLWSASASRVQTSLGAVPGPVQVLAQAQNLLADHLAE